MPDTIQSATGRRFFSFYGVAQTMWRPAPLNCDAIAATDEAEPELIKLSEEQLTRWAQENRPPQSWYERDESELK